MEGRVLAGRYQLLRPLGSGGSGLIFEARRLTDGATVAAKVLRPELVEHEEATRRFLREASIAAQVRHPHLVEVIDAGVDPDDGAPYLVHALLRGVDLAAALAAAKRFSPADAVALVTPVASAIDALHAVGVVHRDVKPANIFLADGIPVLLDFGVAKHTADEAAPRTATGARLGTPSYMAPEQADGRRDLDGRCDVWAVGVVLYELITGHNPFAGRTLGESLARVRTLRPPALAACVPGVSEALSAVVARALEPERERRWPSMTALLEALHASGSAPPPSSETLPASRPPTPRREGNGATRRVGAPPWSRAAAAVALVAFLALLAAVLLPRPRGSYVVRVVVEPPHATVTWNGRPLGAGNVEGTALRDGHVHTLRFAAPGHAPHTVVFRDAPPPGRVALRPE